MKTSAKISAIWRILCGDRHAQPPSVYGVDDHEYLADFRADRFGGAPAAGWGGNAVVGEKGQTVKVAVHPKDVLAELGRIPSNWSLEGLNDKIEILEEKRELIQQKYSADEVEGLILCLRNRRKYDRKMKSGQTFREFFSQFDATDQLKIDALIKKYDLVFQVSDIYVPEFPAAAAKAMTACSNATQEICGKKPRFYVIANGDQFRDAAGKRDPILLTQSPFGFYYYILGAWDKEMLYLPEL